MIKHVVYINYFEGLILFDFHVNTSLYFIGICLVKDDDTFIILLQLDRLKSV